jgi:hypothetical protein
VQLFWPVRGNRDRPATLIVTNSTRSCETAWRDALRHAESPHTGAHCLAGPDQTERQAWAALLAGWSGCADATLMNNNAGARHYQTMRRVIKCSYARWEICLRKILLVANQQQCTFVQRAAA